MKWYKNSLGGHLHSEAFWINNLNTDNLNIIISKTITFPDLNRFIQVVTYISFGTFSFSIRFREHRATRKLSLILRMLIALKAN